MTSSTESSFLRCSCKQQQDLLSFLAVVLGLDNPAVSRLRLTWEVSASRAAAAERPGPTL